MLALAACLILYYKTRSKSSYTAWGCLASFFCYNYGTAVVVEYGLLHKERANWEGVEWGNG
jgi:hypothetical protein